MGTAAQPPDGQDPGGPPHPPVSGFSEDDIRFMQYALELAHRGLYTTTPNPRVGCVIVRDGQIIAEGWHEKAGGPHAEAHALAQAHAAGIDVRGATAYVTLEPCSHHGRTPPCADALVTARLARVVAACADTNPLVAGRGMARLQAAGIHAQTGLLEDAAHELNIGFFSRMQRGQPWVRLKAAISLDGFVALPGGQSQWITDQAARQDGHHWRARACAMLTGIGTVKADNPQMTVRGITATRQPLRVIVDSRLEIDLAARILSVSEAPVCIAHAVDGLEVRSPGIDFRHAPGALQKKADALRQMGVDLLYLPGKTDAPDAATESANGEVRPTVDLKALMRALAARGVNELHVEAGGRLNASLIQQGLVDELLIYQAPRLLGDGQRFAALPAASDLAHSWDWTVVRTDRLGQDTRIILHRRSG